MNARQMISTIMLYIAEKSEFLTTVSTIFHINSTLCVCAKSYCIWLQPLNIYVDQV